MDGTLSCWVGELLFWMVGELQMLTSGHACRPSTTSMSVAVPTLGWQ